jgi:alkylated DNA repair dioxygenase AlkB
MSLISELKLVENFYDLPECQRIYSRLLTEQHWPENQYSFGGRRFVLPRLQTWHADDGIVYSYSNNLLETRPWTVLLSNIKNRIETFLKLDFNAALVNFYRDGQDYVGWHADDETEMGERPYIASLSFGASRQFAFRRKAGGQQEQLLLHAGSLLVMQPDFQRHWLHSLPKDNLLSSGRINLTFRKVLPPDKPFK